MFILKKVVEERDKVDDIICDACKQSVKKQCDYEMAEIHAHWGFDSNHRDGQLHHVQLCQDCYEKVLTFLNIDVESIMRYEEDND